MDPAPESSCSRQSKVCQIFDFLKMADLPIRLQGQHQCVVRRVVYEAKKVGDVKSRVVVPNKFEFA